MKWSCAIKTAQCTLRVRLRTLRVRIDQYNLASGTEPAMKEFKECFWF